MSWIAKSFGDHRLLLGRPTPCLLRLTPLSRYAIDKLHRDLPRGPERALTRHATTAGRKR